MLSNPALSMHPLLVFYLFKGLEEVFIVFAKHHQVLGPVRHFCRDWEPFPRGSGADGHVAHRNAKDGLAAVVEEVNPPRR